MMPSSGQIYKLNNAMGGFEAQIGEGEREGADSGRPELESRIVLQFQLDKAPGVASAQLIWSGYEARRTSVTTALGTAGGDYTTTQQTELNGTLFQTVLRIAATCSATRSQSSCRRAGSLWWRALIAVPICASCWPAS